MKFIFKNSVISIEDFHSRLQETTNFPLRPFVIPFLRANLPLLQKELLHFASSTSSDAIKSSDNTLGQNDYITNQNIENVLNLQNGKKSLYLNIKFLIF